MEKQNEIKIFEDKQVRTIWDAEGKVVYLYNRCYCCSDPAKQLSGSQKLLESIEAQTFERRKSVGYKL